MNYDSPYSIRFIMQEQLVIDTKKLDKIAKLIVKWNENIPPKYQMHVMYLFASNIIHGIYHQGYDQISISAGSFDEDVEEIIIIHELSHKEFNWRLQEIMEFEPDKGQIYADMSAKYDSIIKKDYSFMNQNIKGSQLIRVYLSEGEYWKEHYGLGHPQDELTELFASYRNIKFWKPDELYIHLARLKILSHEAWADIRELLILVDEFCI